LIGRSKKKMGRSYKQALMHGRKKKEVSMMTKERLTFFILIVMSLLLVLTLAGCASDTPAVEPEAPAEDVEAPEEDPEAPAEDAEATEEEPEPVELSFEASEYVNPEYGFSVQYPAEWSLNPIEEPSTIVLYAVAEAAVPLTFVNVDEAENFEAALDGAIAAADGSGVDIKSQEDTTLADGTAATKAVFKFKHPAAPLALDAVAVAAEKDGKWITVTVGTVGLLASFDEDLFFEIAHTLYFD
jgi:uncharacterized lipoprotein NlpE involved in copper resistance